MRRSRAAIVGAALLKKQVARSGQRVRHELGLFLLRHPQDDVYEALGDQAVRSAAFAPPAAILSSTMSMIAQCRHSSASCSDRLGTSSLGITVAFANSLRAWHHIPLSQLDLPWRARKVRRMSYVREVLQPGEEIRFRTNVQKVHAS